MDTPTWVHKETLGPLSEGVDWGLALITVPEILPLCFCNKVTFDLYGENSVVYLFMKILH